MNEMVISDKQNFAKQTFGAIGTMIGLATKTENGTGKAYAVENSSGYAMRNIVEIEIDNSDMGSADVILYIGGPACLAGYPQLFGLDAGAADDAVIKDQYGIGVKFTQGIGTLLRKGAYIGNFQVIADVEDSPQLRKPIVVRQFFPNGDTIGISFPAASTFEMTDQRKNMMKDEKQVFLIDPNNDVEYTIVKDFVGSILFEVKAMDLTSFMNLIATS